MDPLTALRRIAYLLERTLQPTYRVKAFRTAAHVVATDPDGVRRHWEQHTLTELRGIGDKTAAVIAQAYEGAVPDYLATLEDERRDLVDLDPAAQELFDALRGDLHSHSDWSDGGSPIEEMAVTAVELGREYQVLTDHSPRLTVAHGLTADRLRHQLDVLDDLAPRLAPFRLLSGIEVDILDDGALDQSTELLDRLDVVVASVHSKLAMEPAAMTRRMIAAVRNPHTDVLGHCTGRMVGPKKRAQSTFDAEAVFAACAENDVAVEINSRPERQDPPEELIAIALDAGCRFSIDTDAHAPGQLEWLVYGCDRAARCGVPADRIVNTGTVEELLAWTGR